MIEKLNSRWLSVDDKIPFIKQSSENSAKKNIANKPSIAAIALDKPINVQIVETPQSELKSDINAVIEPDIKDLDEVKIGIAPTKINESAEVLKDAKDENAKDEDAKSTSELSSVSSDAIQSKDKNNEE